MSMSFPERMREARRLALLQLLDMAGAVGASDALLHEALPGEGIGGSFDQVRADLAWLDEQGLIDLTRGDKWVARITARGIDVARDRAVYPGVQRPRPE